MPLPPLDQLTVDHQHYVFRDGDWTTPAGLCVSTAQGQMLTMAFLAEHGRAPCVHQAASVVSVAPKPRKAKVAPAKPPALTPTATKAERPKGAAGSRPQQVVTGT